MIGFGKTARNIGSKASQGSMNKAEMTSIGDRTRRVTGTSRGSSAGLNAEKSVLLEGKGNGYSNPELLKKDLKQYPKQPTPSLEHNVFRPEVNVNNRRDLTKPKGLL